MKKENEMRLGKYQKAMLNFAKKFNGWHSITTIDNNFTLKVAQSLQKRGLLKINQFRQFKAA